MENVKLSGAHSKVQPEAPARYYYHGLVEYQQCVSDGRKQKQGDLAWLVPFRTDDFQIGSGPLELSR